MGDGQAVAADRGKLRGRDREWRLHSGALDEGIVAGLDVCDHGAELAAQGTTVTAGDGLQGSLEAVEGGVIILGADGEAVLHGGGAGGAGREILHQLLRLPEPHCSGLDLRLQRRHRIGPVALQQRRNGRDAHLCVVGLMANAAEGGVRLKTK